MYKMIATAAAMMMIAIIPHESTCLGDLLHDGNHATDHVKKLHVLKSLTFENGNIVGQRRRMDKTNVNSRRLAFKNNEFNVDMILEESSGIFSHDAVLTLVGGMEKTVRASQYSSKVFTMEPLREQGSFSDWGILLERNDGTLHALFSINNGSRVLQMKHVDELRTDFSDQESYRRLLADARETNYVVHDINDDTRGHRELKGQDKKKKEESPCGATDGDEEKLKNPRSKNDFDRSANELAQAKFGTITPFFPGCFPGDGVTRDLSMGIATDFGYFLQMGSKVEAAMKDIETIVASTRFLYKAQFNVQVLVNKVIISQDANGPIPLRQATTLGTCDMNSDSLLESFAKWKSTSRPGDYGLWHLLTACWPPGGVVGKGYIGTACSSGSANVAITSRISSTSTFIIFGHEVGHNFGATHSFEFGQGLTGGIMDYGNFLYNGIIQFHPLKRPEVCGLLEDLVKLNCKHLTVSNNQGGVQCGNGLIEKGEDCECFEYGSKSCGSCQNCQINDRTTCSTSLFMMRMTPAEKSNENPILALASNVADPGCCLNNNLQGADTTCRLSNGFTGSCQFGKCVAICNRLALVDCAPTEDGCKLPCRYTGSSVCSSEMLTSSRAFLSYVQDGVLCGKGKGTCFQGKCLPAGTPTPPPVAPTMPTRAPTRYPTAPTSVPTIPTQRPTKSVTLPPFSLRPTTSNPTLGIKKTSSPTPPIQCPPKGALNFCANRDASNCVMGGKAKKYCELCGTSCGYKNPFGCNANESVRSIFQNCATARKGRRNA